MKILSPLAIHAALHIYFHHLLLIHIANLYKVPLLKCEGDRKDLQALASYYRQSFFISFSLLSLSCSFLRLSLSSLTSSIPLHTLLATVRFLYSLSHTHGLSIICILSLSQSVYKMYKTFTKLQWLILSFSQSIQNVYRLPPVWCLHQLDSQLAIIQLVPFHISLSYKQRLNFENNADNTAIRLS